MCLLMWRLKYLVFTFFFVLSAVTIARCQDCTTKDLSRVEEARRCRKSCSNDSDCRGELKKCRCDDVCGLSCFNPNAECNDPGMLINGEMQGDNRTYGSIIRYRCNQGYILRGTRTRKCRSDRKWSGETPSCSAGCLPPRSSRSAFPEVADGMFEIGTVVTYVCRFGYFSVGNTNVTCQENGWSEHEFRCERVDCEEPGEILNGYKEGDDFRFGSRVYYHCDLGYNLLERQNYLSCNSEAEWRGKLPTCEAVQCEAPLAPNHGSVDDREVQYSYGNQIRYSCNAGYKLEGNLIGSCNENQTWGELPACIVDKNCDFEDFQRPTCEYISTGLGWIRTFSSNVPNELRGFVSRVDFLPEQSNVETTLLSPRISRNTSICLQFHYLIRKLSPATDFSLKVISSRESRLAWSPNFQESRNEWLNADLLFPRFVGNIQFKFIVKKSGRTSTSIDLDDILVSSNIECADECDPNPCMNGGICINRIGRYECICRSGYTGETCFIKSGCFVPEQPRFGSISTSKKAVEINELITFSCYKGYRLNGASQVRCVGDKTWSDNVPECRIRTCVHRQPPADSTASRSKSLWEYGDVVTYRCNTGFELSGSHVLTCGANGRWSNTLPKCIRQQLSEYSSCPSGYTYYSWFCYKIVNVDKTYTAAENDCANNGAIITSVHEDEMLKAVRSRLPRSYIFWLRGNRGCVRYSKNILGYQGYYNDWAYDLCVARHNYICVKWESQFTPISIQSDDGRGDGTYAPIPGVMRKGLPVYRINDGQSYFLYRYKSFQSFYWKIELSSTRLFNVKSNAVLPQNIREQWKIIRTRQNISLAIQTTSFWMSWSEWSTCSSTCGDGIHSRTRSCSRGYLPSSIYCSGLNKETRPCTVQSCTDKNNNLECTEDGDKCHFPFTYRGFTFEHCTTFLSYGTPWCSLTGEYLSRWGNCAPCQSENCAPPTVRPPVVISGIIQDAYEVDSVVTFTCSDPNEVVIGSEELICTRDGIWNRDPPSSCTVNPCNSYLCLNGGTCNREEGSFTCNCTEGHTGATCNIRVTCARPTLASSIRIENENRDRYAIGSILTFTCVNRNENIVGNRRITCKSNGKWNRKTPSSCSARRCPRFTIPDHATMIPRGSTELYSPDSGVFFRCDDGYHLIGSSTIICESNYEWSDPVPLCEEMGCTIFEPAIPPGVRISELTGFEYQPGETLQVTCKVPHKTLNDVSTLTCSGRNIWQPNYQDYSCL